MTDVRHFPTLENASTLLDEFLPQMMALLEKPHLDSSLEWWSLLDQLDAIFAEHGWEGDESRVAFDLLVAFAERASAKPIDWEEERRKNRSVQLLENEPWKVWGWKA